MRFPVTWTVTDCEAAPISSQLCSDQYTALSGAGLFLFSIELS